jgi:hypothetical protein
VDSRLRREWNGVNTIQCGGWKDVDTRHCRGWKEVDTRLCGEWKVVRYQTFVEVGKGVDSRICREWNYVNSIQCGEWNGVILHNVEDGKERIPDYCIWRMERCG